MNSSSSFFYEINAVNELHNGHFGTYLEMLLNEESYRSKQGKDSFYKSDAQVAKKLGMTRRTIIKYRMLAEELKLCFVSLSNFGSSHYRIYVDKITDFLRSGYKIYMQRIRNQEMACGIRAERKKAWEYLTSLINESFIQRCEMNSQGVCNEFTPYCNTNTVNINNNNSPVVVISKTISQEKQKEQEILVSNSVQISCIENLDPQLFPPETIKPLANELIKVFRLDASSIKRYKDVGPEVGKWMVWNTALSMREGKTLEEAASGTVLLVTNPKYGFTKPRTLTKYENELSKKEKEKRSIESKYVSFDSNTAITFEAQDKVSFSRLRMAIE